MHMRVVLAIEQAYVWLVVHEPMTCAPWQVDNTSTAPTAVYIGSLQERAHGCRQCWFLAGPLFALLCLDLARLWPKLGRDSGRTMVYS